MKRKIGGELTERQAVRVIEMYENGARNGEEWAHDVCLHRGTEKYERCLSTLNEAFKITNQDRVIAARPSKDSDARRRRR